MSDFTSSAALLFGGLLVEPALGRRVVVVGDPTALAVLRAAVAAGVVVVGMAVAVVATEVTTDDGGVTVPDGPGPPLAEQALSTTMADAATADQRSATFTTSPSCHNRDRTVRP